METTILRALPSALRGVSTPTLPFDSTGHIVLPNNVPFELASTLSTVLEPCLLWRALDTELKRSSPRGAIAQALIRAVKILSMDYLKTVSGVERLVASVGPSGHVHQGRSGVPLILLSEIATLLNAPTISLRFLLIMLKRSLKQPEDILGMVWEFTQHGDELIASYATKVFNFVSTPFESLRKEWENHGNLDDDTYGEFYVRLSHDVGKTNYDSTIGVRGRSLGFDRSNLDISGMGGSLAVISTLDSTARRIPEFVPQNVPRGLMTEEEAVNSFQRGLAVHFVRYVCEEMSFDAVNKSYSAIMDHARRLLVQEYDLLVHLQGLKDYMLLGRANFLDALFRVDNAYQLLHRRLDTIGGLEPSEFLLNVLDEDKKTLWVDSKVQWCLDVTVGPVGKRRASSVDSSGAAVNGTKQVWHNFMVIYHLKDGPLRHVVDGHAMKLYALCNVSLWRIRLAVHTLTKSALGLWTFWRSSILEAEETIKLETTQSLLNQSFLELESHVYLGVIEKEWRVLMAKLGDRRLHQPEIKALHDSYLERIRVAVALPGKYRAIERGVNLVLRFEFLIASMQRSENIKRAMAEVETIQQSFEQNLNALMG